MRPGLSVVSAASYKAGPARLQPASPPAPRSHARAAGGRDGPPRPRAGARRPGNRPRRRPPSRPALAVPAGPRRAPHRRPRRRAPPPLEVPARRPRQRRDPDRPPRHVGPRSSSPAPRWAPSTTRTRPPKHDHVVLDLETGARITLNDARRFGAIDLWPTPELDAHRLLAGLGPEPLGNGFNAAYLAQRLAGRATAVKAALLDQRTVAGLGNIYVCEALWRARISPLELARDVTPPETETLVATVRAVLLDAIAAGGSSLRDYRQADGELGYFQHAFAVYDREDTPCPRPGCPGTIARVVQSGRSSFYCPVCQT